MVNEKRRFSRIPFDAEVEVRAGESRWKSALVDVSLKGALVARPPGQEMASGERCALEIRLSDSDVAIDMDASVAHIDEAHIGFRCEHIGLDDMSRLRRLVELNLGDPELLDRELSALL